MSSLPRFIVCKPPDFTDSVLSNRASAHFTLHGLSLLRYRARRSVFGGVDDRRSLMVSLSSSICLETKAAFSLQISIKSTLLKSVSLPPLLNSPFNPPLKLSSFYHSLPSSYLPFLFSASTIQPSSSSQNNLFTTSVPSKRHAGSFSPRHTNSGPHPRSELGVSEVPYCVHQPDGVGLAIITTHGVSTCISSET